MEMEMNMKMAKVRWIKKEIEIQGWTEKNF